MIRRIRVRNYKSLRGVEVALGPLSVLFGPNAAGKSNFLDALQLLSRMASSRTLKEAFEPPYRGKPMESFTLDEGGLEGLLAKKSARFAIEADVELSPAVIAAVDRDLSEMRRGGESRKFTSHIHHTRLRYRVEIEISPKSGMLHVAAEYLAPLGRDGNPKSKPQPFLETIGERIHLRMEGQAHPTYFDRLLDHTIVSRPHYPPHYPHLTALKKEMESWLFFYLEPRERMRASTGVKEVRHIGLMGEDLAAFLNTLLAIT